MAPELEIKSSIESARAVGQGYQPVTGHQESVDCEGGERRPGFFFWKQLSPGEGSSCLYTCHSWMKASQLCFCSALGTGETCLPLAFQNTN